MSRDSYTPPRGSASLGRTILTACLLAGLIPSSSFAQDDRKTVTIEAYVPEGARLLVEGHETKATGTKRCPYCPPSSARPSVPLDPQST